MTLLYARSFITISSLEVEFDVIIIEVETNVYF